MVGWFMLLLMDELMVDLCATKKGAICCSGFFDVCFKSALADGHATWTDGRTSWRNNDRTGMLVWTLLWDVELGL